MDTETPTPTEPQPSPRPRRLTRSTDDRVIGGVSGGLGAYFDVDPVLFRIAAVALVVFGGAGLLLYAAAWVLIPNDQTAPGAGVRGRFTADGARRAGLVLGVLAVSGLPWPWRASCSPGSAARWPPG